MKKKKKINTSNFQIKVNIQKQLQLIRQPNFGLKNYFRYNAVKNKKYYLTSKLLGRSYFNLCHV